MNPSLYSVMLHAHSVIRWIVLLLLVFAILNSLIAGRRPFIRTDARLGLLLTIFADLMLLIGIYLWYVGDKGYHTIQRLGSMAAVMKDPAARFFVVEHTTGMILAIILIHIGKAQGRKHISDRAKHNRTLLFYLIALIIILVSIPWPFRQIGMTSGTHWY
jgi:hypothetical protein